MSIYFLLFFSAMMTKNDVAYASEIKVEDFIQIDLKNNIHDGKYGEVEHYTKVIDYVVLDSGMFIAYVTVKDDVNYYNQIITYDINGKIISKEKLVNYTTSGKFFKISNKTILVTILKSGSRRYPVIHFFNENCEKTYEYVSNINFKDINFKLCRVSIKDKVILALKNDDDYLLIESPINVFEIEDEEEIKNVDAHIIENKVSPSYSDDECEIYIDQNQEIWMRYIRASNPKKYLFYKVGGVNTKVSYQQALKYNVWIDREKKLTNVICDNGKKIILESNNERYIYDVETNIMSSYDEIIDETLCDFINEEMLKNKSITYDDLINEKIKFFEDRYISIVTENMKNYLVTYNSNNEKIDFYELENTENKSGLKIELCKFKNIVLKIENDKQIFFIDTHGEIYVYEYLNSKYDMSNSEVKFFDGNKLIVFNKGDELKGCYFLIADIFPVVDIEITKVNNQEINLNSICNTLYLGKNEIIIEGKILSDVHKESYLSCVFGDMSKTIEINLEKENEFKFVFKTDEIKEGYYDNIYFKLKPRHENFEDKKYFDEIKFGKRINYKNVFYIKIANNLLLEEYPENSSAMTKNNLLAKAEDEKENYLSQEEYETYKEYIITSPKYKYALQEDSYVYNEKVYLEMAKNDMVYERKVNKMNIDEIFYYNTLDDCYYDYFLDNENIYKTNVNFLISYASANQPYIEIEPKNTSYVNSDVQIDIYMNDIDFQDEETLNLKIEKINFESSIKEEILKKEILLTNENIEKLEESDKKYIVYSLELKTSGFYEITVSTTNKFGNDSLEENAVIKIDKEKPIIKNIEYLDLYEDETGNLWTNNEECKVLINVREESTLKVFCNNQELEVNKTSYNEYKTSLNVNSNEQTRIYLVDEAGNQTEFDLNMDFKVEKIKPHIENVRVEYYDEYAKINILAEDDESKIKDIFFKVINFDKILSLDETKNIILEFENMSKTQILQEYARYDNEIKLYRKDYDRNTYLLCFAVDYAGNESTLSISQINLNSKVTFELVLLGDEKDTDKTLKDDDILHYDLEKLLKFKINILDEDENDKHSIKLKLDDFVMLEKRFSDGEREVLINLQDYQDFIKSLEYEKEYVMQIIVSDGECFEETKTILIKENMIPKVKVSIKKFAFENFTECIIDINDLDVTPYNRMTIQIKNVSGNRSEKIFESNLNNGKNRVILTNGLKEGINNLKFIICDYNSRVVINKKIMIREKLSVSENEILIVKLDEKYDLRFIEMLKQLSNNEKRESIVVVGMSNEIKKIYENELESYEVYTLEEIKNNIKEIKMNKFFILVSEMIEEESMTLKDLLSNEKTILIETGNEFIIEDIKFIDYEKDYYLNDRGKNRNLKVFYDPLQFENVHDEYEEVIYDDENKTISEMQEKYKTGDVNFSPNKVKFKIQNAGKYEITLNEEDYIVSGDIDYSKSSNNEKQVFYAHNKPYSNIKYEEIAKTNESIKIKVTKEAYDKDFLSINKGIKKMQLIIRRYDYNGKLDDEDISEVEFELDKLKLRDEGKLEEFNDYQNSIISQMFQDSVIDIKENEKIEIIFKVWDFGIGLEENEFEFSSEDSICIEKFNNIPYGSFDYYLKNENEKIYANRYVYVLDNFENLVIEEDIEYNDLFTSDGIRQKVYKISEGEIRKEIGSSNFFEENINKKMVVNNLEIINRLNNSYKTENIELEVIKLDVYNNTTLNESYLKDDGFKMDEDIKVQIEVKNLKNDEDVYLTLNGKLMKSIGGGKYESILLTSEIKEYYEKMNVLDIETNFNLKSNEQKEDKNITYEYQVKIYSSRDNSLLANKAYNFKLIEEVEILDFEITKIYDESYKGNVPFSYIDMPISKIKKGYAFDFEITTKGLEDIKDLILVTPKFYFISENDEVKETELYRINNEKREKVETLIIQNESVIGNLEYLTLTNNQRIHVEDCQKWCGRFFIPADAYPLVKNDEDINLVRTGMILVNFNIKAYRDKIELYDFNIEKWNYENSSPYNESGDVIIYDNTKSVMDDYNGFTKY